MENKLNQLFPILVVPAVPIERGIRFLHQTKQFDIKGEISKDVWQVLSFCNGYVNIEGIAEMSKLKLDYVEAIISDLKTMEVVVDSREQYLRFHNISNYPADYVRKLSHSQVVAHSISQRLPTKSGKVLKFHKNKRSHLFDLQTKRESCRSFSCEPLTRDQIGNICSFGYAISRHSVPSGGGLYPLKIYVIIANDQTEMMSGYYEYDAENDTLILYDKKVDIEQLKYCFNSESLAFNSPVQIIIAADIHRQPYKYANRGYRLTLFEVGHVAQNISLYCEEQGIGCCELGGILDEVIAKELGMPEEVKPMLAIAVGRKSNNKLFDESIFLQQIEEEFVKPGLVSDYGSISFIAEGSFFGGYARFGDRPHEIAGATAVSAQMATAKAIIEGYERYQSNKVRIDFTGTSKEIKGPWLDPRTINPLTEEQAKRGGLVVFNEDLCINWTSGKELSSGKEILVPTDIVYYGHESSQNRICYSDSSGIAAFSTIDEAINRAITELVERDAIMRNWFEQKSPPKISKTSLSIHVQKRIEYWESRDFSVYVLDMKSPYAFVVQVVIVGDQYPFFVKGAAASNNLLENAINKAFHEAEYGLLMKLKKPTKTSIRPEEVRLPEHHGQLYNNLTNRQKIEWLWSSDEISLFSTCFKGDTNLERLLDVVVVDMSSRNSSIKVVRALSKKVLPISFGYNMDYYTHPMVSELDFNPNSRDLLHYFD